jgi:hypothetical protein
MKAQTLFTAAALAATLMLPACASHEKSSDVKVSHELVSGDEASGNYVERVTEKGSNYSKTTLVTHSVTTQTVPDGSINPNVTTHSVKETTVRKVTKDGKTKIEKSATESHSVTPVAAPATTTPATTPDAAQ